MSNNPNSPSNPEDLPIITKEAIRKWEEDMERWKNSDYNPNNIIHTEDLIGIVETQAATEVRTDEADDTYIDRRMSIGLNLYVDTQAERHLHHLDLHNPLDRPEQIDYYSIDLASRPKIGPERSYYIKINTVDRDLVIEIHDAVVAKLQETGSDEKTEHWLLHESIYSQRKSTTNPNAQLVGSMHPYLEHIDNPIES